jgi:hypothetical protein
MTDGRTTEADRGDERYLPPFRVVGATGTERTVAATHAVTRLFEGDRFRPMTILRTGDGDLVLPSCNVRPFDPGA